MKSLCLFVALSLVLIPVSMFGSEPRATLSFLLPGGTSRIADGQAPLRVVVESGYISHENRPIPPAELVNYMNGLLQTEKTTRVAVFIRQGLSFGEVIGALDELRRTNASAIGVSLVELRPGQAI